VEFKNASFASDNVGKGGIRLWNHENNTWGRKGWELLE